MAIATDDVTEYFTQDQATSFQFNHTCTGSDLGLFVSVCSNSNVTPTVTYNSVSMTQVSTSIDIGLEHMAMWYLEDPSTGSNEVVIDFGATAPNYIGAVAHSYTGAGSITNEATSYEVTNYGTIDITVGTSTSCVIVGAGFHGADGDPFTPDADSIEQWDFDTGGGTSYADVAVTGGYKIPGGTGTYDWASTASASDDFGLVGCELQVAGAPPPALPFTSINIGDTWKTISGAAVIKINIADSWKNISGAWINVADSWKAVTIS